MIKQPSLHIAAKLFRPWTWVVFTLVLSTFISIGSGLPKAETKTSPNLKPLAVQSQKGVVPSASSAFDGPAGTGTGAGSGEGTTSDDAERERQLQDLHNLQTQMQKVKTSLEVSFSQALYNQYLSLNQQVEALARQLYLPRGARPATQIANTPNTAQFFSGSLGTGDPTFNRPTVGTACGRSSLGTAVFYDVYQLTKPQAGTVRLSLAGSGSQGQGNAASHDSFLVIYQSPHGTAGAFNPASPCTNFIQAVDDTIGNDPEFTTTTSLAAGTYYVVVTSFGNGATGTYDLSIEDTRASISSGGILISGQFGTMGSGACDNFMTGVQMGRIFRDGIPSACPTKAYPGIFNTTTAYNYDAYTFTNNLGSSQCITINFDPNNGGTPCGTNAHASGYLDSYDPTSQAMNFVGDVGSSVTQPFSFEVPANGIFLVVVSNTASQSICTYQFEVVGNVTCGLGAPCTNPNVNLLVADTTNSRIQKLTAGGGDPTILNVGPINGTLGNGSPDCSSFETGVQSGRIFRDAIPSACPSKAYPGIFNVGTNYNYDAYTFVNNMATAQCITVNFDPNAGGTVCGTNAHASGYLNSYDPTNQAMNFVGDVGSSVTQPFSFEVPANGIFLVVVTNTSGQANCTYQFTIVGDVTCGDTPPANWSVLMGSGTTVGKVKNPKGVTQTADGATIYVADTGNNRIQKSTDSGTTWAVVTITGVTPNTLKSPAAVAVIPNDPNIVYVADTGNNRVLVSSDGGASWSILAGAGSSPNQVRGPEGLVADCDGHLWIADTLNNRIVAYEPVETTPAAPVTPGSGIVVAGIGSALNQVRGPKGVTVDVLTGDLFVADTGNNRVTQYTNGPVCTAVTSANASLVAGPGSALGQVRSPAGITVSGGLAPEPPRGSTKVANTGVLSLVIGDTLNNRIQQAELTGNFQVGGFSLVVGATPGQTATIGSAVGQFRAPTGVR